MIQEKMDLYDIVDYSVFENHYIMIDTRLYSSYFIEQLIEEITKDVSISGVLLVGEEDLWLEEELAYGHKGVEVIDISRTTADSLVATTDIAVSIESESVYVKESGHNIVGIFPGTDPNMSEEAIVIAMNYNYLDVDGSHVMKFNYELMEALCQNKKK